MKDQLLRILDREIACCSTAVLCESDPKLQQGIIGRMTLAQDLVYDIQRMEDPDSLRHTVQGVIDRLQRKVNARPSVSRDPVASDNLRLAIRALRTVIEPAPADSEPIDIFIV